MPPADSAALIVARFLKSNRYEESYDAFVREAGLPQDAGTVGKGDLTLEVLLEEKKTFDVSVQFEKLGVEDEVHEWTVPAPSTAMSIPDLPQKSNLLSATVGTLASSGNPSQQHLFASSATRRLHILDVPSCELRTSTATLHDSPILSSVVLRDRVLITASMSGRLIASDLDGNVLDKRTDHSKYIVKAAVLHTTPSDIIATAGWDCEINIYTPGNDQPFKFRSPFATISLPTKPEAMLLMQHPDTHEPILIISRADSNLLYFYTTESEPRLLGQQNLAPHSNAWVAFTPSALALCPADPTLLAVGTNSLPHMKLLIVRLLIPPFAPEAVPTAAPTVRRSLLDDTPVPETQASQARAALAIADREAAAIQIHCNTMAPQTAYSTPAIAWRPDSTGVFVNGDDGAIRGIETSTGKVKTVLKGHEEGSKVRCLWAGEVVGEEWLVSGGFDQQLIVWKIDRNGA
ncbi:uncharacterized protein LTR77_003703 [Saxophila tyrrhenica]|uniref:LisH domain-containing protein n=1 Tax=Saxophila tyrrhenica TaxID=1690608 RepID=A0AAV9PHT1_9PEZI|nr:hypothetical protein LTR77_003703 [Saxophila tyrrhenica]